MPRLDWKVALKGLAGFTVGVAVWVFMTPLYNRVIAAGAEAVIRAFEDPKATNLRERDEKYWIIDRSDFDPRSKRPAVQLQDLTFNVVLLTALFAASPRTFSNRNVGGFAAAAVLLGLTHVFGVIAEVMSYYAGRFGMWSTVHYSDFERHFWGVMNHFYRLVLMYALGFALWWIFRDPGTAAVPAKAKKRRKGR